jgi:hypothetical protein
MPKRPDIRVLWLASSLLAILALMPFLTGYTRRKAITIDHTYVDSDLTDFPLLVKIASDAAIGANIDTLGLNIRFTAADGTTLLKYERQSFSVAAGNAAGVFWVKVPTVNGASNTTIYIYYKGGSALDGQDGTNVWDSNFKGVWHLEQDPSGSSPQIIDSTSHGNQGTTTGLTSGDLVNAQVGKGLDLANTDSETNEVTWTIPSGISTTTGYTVEIVFKPYGNAYFSPYLLDFPGNGFTNLRLGTTDPGGGVTGVNFTSQFNSATSTAANNVLHGYAFTQTGVNIALWKNGVLEDSDSFGGTGNMGTSMILGRNSGNSHYAKGVVDELRISDVVRSADWLKFTYRNMFEADNEISFGSEESSGGATILRHLMQLAA